MRIAVFLALFLAVGCKSSEPSGQKSASAFGSLANKERYDRAIEYYDQRNYTMAIASIENLRQRPIYLPWEEELLFRLGDSHHQLRNYHDARRAYSLCLEKYPDGRYANTASTNLMRMEVERSEPEAAAEERVAAAEKDRELLTQLEREFPRDPRIKYLLGNIYYEVKDYQRSGEYYFQAQLLEATYREKELIRQRLRFDEDGAPEALRPDTLQEIELDRNPLVVLDVYPYRERGQRGLDSRHIYANLTGKVHNRSTRIARNVQLEVQFLSGTKNLLDHQTIFIGNLPPGAVRPFLAQARHYDNLYNITDYEVVARELP